jgi:two-component system cell cycle sensor histidine kinase/response regulator CckA
MVLFPADRARRATLLSAGTTLVVLGALGLVADRQVARLARARQRVTTESQTHPAQHALEQALARRLEALPAMRAFLEAGPPGLEVRDDLDAFADGLHASIEGVRTLQYVRGGVIRYTSHPSDNRDVLGYNLLADPRPEIRRDVLRALGASGIILSGPIELLQGGTGLVARLATFRRTDPRFGLVAVVMDLPPLFREAGLADTSDGYRKAVRDSAGTVLFGPPDVFAHDPVTVAVTLPDRSWYLGAVPLRGGAGGGLALWAGRAGLAVIALLGALLAGSLGGRQTRLREAVAARTAELSRANADLAVRVEEIRVADQALREQHMLVRAVVEGSPDLVLVKDLTGAYVLANDAAARAIGRPVHEIIGRTPEDLFPAEFAQDVRKADSEVLEQHGPVTRERRLRIGDEERTFLLVLHTWFDAQGAPAGVVTVGRDLTERLLLEAQLRHAQKLDALGRLSGGIAHDFNNLLTAILANAHLVADAVPDTEPDMRGDVEEIVAAAQRGTELTRKLLAFGRRELLERRPIDLTAVLADNASMMRRLVPEQIDIRLDLPSEPLTVRADQGALGQILLNLVTNARDALPGAGRIEIRLREVERDGQPRARLTVRDTGVGMSEATRAHVFEPFFTTKPAGQGTGLGLSIAYGLVQRHDGTIEIESAPGAGTTVSIELPLAEPGPEPEQAPATGAPAGRSETILVVEDEPTIRDALGRLLERTGYRVLAASDGEAALEMLKRRADIALVISDVVMPRMGGAELARRARRQGVRAPFLFTTGYPGGRGSGAAEPLAGTVLPKPWRPDQLLTTVRQLLDKASPGVAGSAAGQAPPSDG